MTSTAAATPSERLRGRPSDEQLAVRVATGDSTAFEELYERYREPLLGCLRSTLREPEDARDALQITMLNAFRALRESRVPEAVRPWLFTIARNAAVSTTRRRVVHLEIAEDDVPVLDGPAEAVVARERVDDLLGDLEAMPPRRRQVVLMRAVQGLDYEEIGGELGISSSAARQAAREARVALDQTARGRDLRCEDVSAALELGDTRNARSRAFLAHLRACASCRRRLPAGSVTRSQVAGILAGVLAVRTAVSKALGLPAAAIDAIGSASLTAKAASIAAVALTAGSGVVAGLQGDTRPVQPDEAPAAQRANPIVPPKLKNAPIAAPGAASEPRAGSHVPEAPPDGRPGNAADAEPAADPSPATAIEADVATVEDPGQGAAGSEPAPVDAHAARPQPEAKRNDEAGDSPGASGSAPGQGVTPPGQGGTPPGQGGTPPGQSGGSPGASGSAPGQGGTPPGQGGTPPGQGGTPPGQRGTPPGQATTPPGQQGSAPGQSGSAPGQAGTPPGQTATVSGQANAPPEQATTGEAPRASAAAPAAAGAEAPAGGGSNRTGNRPNP